MPLRPNRRPTRSAGRRARCGSWSSPANTSRSRSTRTRRACARAGRSITFSRNRMPPSASRSRQVLGDPLEAAPLDGPAPLCPALLSAPATPNSCSSMSSGVGPEQSTLTNGACGFGSCEWMARAIISRPRAALAADQDAAAAGRGPLHQVHDQPHRGRGADDAVGRRADGADRAAPSWPAPPARARSR